MGADAPRVDRGSRTGRLFSIATRRHAARARDLAIAWASRRPDLRSSLVRKLDFSHAYQGLQKLRGVDELTECESPRPLIRAAARALDGFHHDRRRDRVDVAPLRRDAMLFVAAASNDVDDEALVRAPALIRRDRFGSRRIAKISQRSLIHIVAHLAYAQVTSQ